MLDAQTPPVGDCSSEHDRHDPLVWFITGSASGLGRAIADRAATLGDYVYATSRSFNDEREPREVADGVIERQLDVTVEAQRDAAVAEAIASFGRIDVLVNNAGFGLKGAVESWDMRQLRQLFETNFFAAVDLTKLVLPHMRKAQSGWIVQMSSVAGFRVSPGNSAYSASKFALEGLSEGLADDVFGHGIGVSIVEPGPFRTGFSGQSHAWGAPHSAYEGDLEESLKAYRANHGKQRNDPVKAARILADYSRMRIKPLRIPLGPEAFVAARETFARRLNELDDIEPIAKFTHFNE